MTLFPTDEDEAIYEWDCEHSDVEAHISEPRHPGRDASTEQGGMDGIVGKRQHQDTAAKAGAGARGNQADQPGYADPDVATLVTSIAALLKGNTEEEVELVSSSVTSREVDLNLRVEIGWESEAESFPGARVIRDSVRFDNHAQAEDFLRQSCFSDSRDPGTSARMLAAINKEPAAAFLSWPETWNIGPLAPAAFVVARCRECGATGEVRCLAGCRNGGNPCHLCMSTGMATCFICAGHRGAWVDGQFRKCATCRGTGRHGRCGSCNATGTVRCTFCSGKGKVQCSACAGTAARTEAYSTFLVGHLSRSVTFNPALPEPFRRACETLSRSELVEEGRIDRVDGSSGPATAEAVLRLQVRHVNARLRCGQLSIEVDAIGSSCRVPMMPEFLDLLLADVAAAVVRLSRVDPAACLQQASTTRLGHELLAAAGRGERNDPTTAARRWRGAVSPALLSAMGDALHVAYSRAARVAIRRSWLSASPWLIGAAVLVNAFHLPEALGLVARPMHPAPLSGLASLAAALSCEAVVLSPVLLAAWFVAGLRGRKALVAALGGLARRRPHQGFWPQTLAVVTVGCGLATSWTGLDAASLGVPLAFGPDGHGRPMARMADQYIPAFSSPSGQVAPDALNAPGAQPPPLSSEAETRGHAR